MPWNAAKPAGTDSLKNSDDDLRANNAALEAVFPFLNTSNTHWNQQFNNLLKNGSFESWSAGAAAAPDGWLVAGAGVAIAREATIIRLGEYSAKLTRAGTDVSLYQAVIFPIDADTNTYWRGRIVTLGCWVYATVADRAKLTIADGVADADSALHPGDSAWHFLTATATLNAAATTVTTYFKVITGDTDAYFDGAILVEGTICPTFTPKPAEEVVAWQAWVPTLTGDADLSGYDTARFCRVGKVCFFTFNAENKNVTTAGMVEITLPYSSGASSGNQVPSATVHDGTVWVGQPHLQIAENTNSLTIYKTAAAGGWAGTETGVTIRVSGSFEVA